MSRSLSEAIEIATKKDCSKMELIYDGSSEGNSNPRSYVYKLDNYCVKYYIRTERDCISEEKNLKILEPYGFAPRCFYKSPDNDFIIMEYIDGTPLGKVHSLTAEQETQLKQVMEILRQLNIYYEKIKEHCIVEPTGRLRFIDFGI